MSADRFRVVARDGGARCGELNLDGRRVDTPAFMPVGTRGTVKAVDPGELGASGTQIIVSNTFHLMLRPGSDLVRAHGGLHEMMAWDGAILTDSGGFQVFSLGGRVREEGVDLRSPYDGSPVRLDPEESMRVQRDLGSDIVMVFDECTAWPADRETAGDSMRRSLRWASRSRTAHGDSPAALFGIVQGGTWLELRIESLDGLRAIGFDGYAIGGLAVGEPMEQRLEVLDALVPPHAGRRTALPDGGRHPGGHRGGGVARGGPLRLRAPHPQRPQRPPVRPRRGAAAAQPPLPRGYRAGRAGLRLPRLRPFQPRLPAPSRPFERDSRRTTRNRAQPLALSEADGGSARGGPRRHALPFSARVFGPRGASLWHNFRSLPEPSQKGPIPS